MKIKSYEEAIGYLESFIGKVIFRVNKKFLKKYDPLERMRILLSLLGNPQKKFKSVLIGGTSGKGSTAYLISHILTTSGYKTGITLSPHLQKVNERLQINGESISDEKFIKLLKSSILPSIRQMSKMRIGPPSYFEILVGMAFTYFAKEKVDIAVVEVGMGGEFDATNSLNPLIAVLTNVGLDHTNILGKTVEKIAKTKAGIIKKLKVEKGKLKNISQFSTLNSQLIVVTGVKQPTVIKIVEDKCREVGAKLYRLGKDFNYKIKKLSHEGSVFDLTIDNDRVSQLNDLSILLLGAYQVENASLAIEVVLNLEQFGFEVKEKDIGKALSTAFFPGRFEIIKAGPVASFPPAFAEASAGRPASSSAARPSKLEERSGVGSPSSGATRTVILDGAHNPTKMRAFLSTLKKLYPKERKIFLIGFKFDKDIEKMLKEILRMADAIIVTQFKAKTDTSIHASADVLNIKDQILKIKNDKKVMVEKDSKEALNNALNYPIIQLPNYPSIIVVTGSLYLVGEIRSMI